MRFKMMTAGALAVAAAATLGACKPESSAEKNSPQALETFAAKQDDELAKREVRLAEARDERTPQAERKLDDLRDDINEAKVTGLAKAEKKLDQIRDDIERDDPSSAGQVADRPDAGPRDSGASK